MNESVSNTTNIYMNSSYLYYTNCKMFMWFIYCVRVINVSLASSLHFLSRSNASCKERTHRLEASKDDS